MQHLVGHAEGLGEGGPLVGDAEQVLVGDDDQGVDVALQLADAGVGQAHAVAALEVEGLGDHAHSQDAALAGALGDDRGRPGAGAAAHAGGDEHHVGAVQVLADLQDASSPRSCRLGMGARASLGRQTPSWMRRSVLAKASCWASCSRPQLNAFKPGLDHVVDRIAAGPADAKDHDARLQFCRAAL